jgi:phage portal protein BeeE
MPIGMNKNLDLMKVQTLYNLPSQFIKVNTTGKLYDQIELSGIIQEYALTNYDPVKKFDPEEIIHFNEVNISSDMATIMGISKLEALKMPITNIQNAFEAMNTVLSSGGAKGIISPQKKDDQGSVSLMPKEKKDLQDDFKDYGLLNSQNPFLISPISLDYTRVIMNSIEMGIYEEFSNNSILVANEFGVPPELLKTYIQGATSENQIQSVRRLYQDTTIPMVADEDDYWSFRLNTFEYGFKIETRWDHIPALSVNKKENAQTLSFNERASNEAYTNNRITLNQSLEMIDLPTVDGGDVYKVEWDKKNKVNETESNENE